MRKKLGGDSLGRWGTVFDEMVHMLEVKQALRTLNFTATTMAQQVVVKLGKDFREGEKRAFCAAPPSLKA